MRNPLARTIGGIIGESNPATALDDAEAIARSNDLRDHLPLEVTRQPTYEEMKRTAHHETGHLMFAVDRNIPVHEVRIRWNDGTGLCRVGTFETHEDKILFALVGVIAEVKYYAPAIHRYINGTYDFLVARLLIDQWNEKDEWPPMTYEGAARKAVAFVDKHFGAIRSLALVLMSNGDLTAQEIRVFSRLPL